MTEQPEASGFQAKVRDLFQRGMSNHIVVQKDDRKVVDLPIILVLVAALLAVWLVVIMWVIALLTGYDVRIVDTAPVPADSAGEQESLALAVGEEPATSDDSPAADGTGTPHSG